MGQQIVVHHPYNGRLLGKTNKKNNELLHTMEITLKSIVLNQGSAHFSLQATSGPQPVFFIKVPQEQRCLPSVYIFSKAAFVP